MNYTINFNFNTFVVYLFGSPTSDGGAAAILCSEKFVRERGLEDKAVEIMAMEMATDLPSTFQARSCIKVVS